MRRLGVGDARAFAELDADIFGHEAWPPGVIEDQLASDRIVAIGVDAELPESNEPRSITPATRKLDAAGMLGLGIEAELLTISVRPSRRREGLASHIITALLESAEGAEACFLEVRASDDGARALYEGLGFVEVGRRRRYYRDDDAVVMRKELGKPSLS
ncbi:MAG: GNAT family N-acetyltransferase [Flaviflexus sp.]|uniref:GNAT family N-acetyltransferase n=1 Tax=Flaviflexus sp. TaxID=1969482 RepID=UPI00352F0434